MRIQFRLSPDGLWLIGSTRINRVRGYYTASSNGKTINWYQVPGTYSGYGPIPCSGYPYQNAWRPDSKQFAVFPAGEKLLSVWNIQEDGSVLLSEKIVLQHCPMDLVWSVDENKFIIKW